MLSFSESCPIGSEITVSGACELCKKGTYRAKSEEVACQQCPYGFTTNNTGATSKDLCDIGTMFIIFSTLKGDV